MTTDQESDIFDDLAAEYGQLDRVLAALAPDQWTRQSAAVGWTIADVVLHLAQTEEYVIASAAGEKLAFRREAGLSVDEAMERAVAADRGAPADMVLERWRTASRSALGALRACSPTDRLAWATIPLSTRTLATTRIAEHWAHALDITDALGLDYPDTARLRHIAWLAHRTLPYALSVAGEDAGPVRCELIGPAGEVWRFGDPRAPSVIKGPAAEFCRVGVRRLLPEDSTLVAEGPDALTALRVMRNYAV